MRTKIALIATTAFIASVATFKAAEAQMPTPSHHNVHLGKPMKGAPVSMRSQYIHDANRHNSRDGKRFSGASDIYMGVSGGAAFVSGREDLLPGNVQDKFNDIGYNVKGFIGTFFTNHFGLEAAVHYFGGITDKDNRINPFEDGLEDDKISALAGSLSLVGRIAFTEQTTGIAKIGGLYGRVLEKDGNTNSRFGATDFAPVSYTHLTLPTKA
jgi:hypothetical protein